MQRSTVRIRNRNLISNSRVIEVRRGSNGYGFTLSGQKPSILSNIIENSAADLAGLQTGDFLLAINNQSVIQWSHDQIIEFIGKCHNQLLKLQVADNFNYFHMDEDNNQNLEHENATDNDYDVVCNTSTNSENGYSIKLRNEMLSRKIRDYTHIEYKFFLKYVGSIELSNEFLAENKKNYFDIVLKCIKKLKNEKRIPYSIIMTIVPSYLMLTNENQIILATFSSKQILCINDERNSNYFGLITHNPIDLHRMQCSSDNHSMISCHVFYVDKDLLDHKIHCYFNEKLHLKCTFDIVTGHCLQFPENSFYIQTIIRNLYGLAVASSSSSSSNPSQFSNSPRKQKHKLPRTTSSSNSDSGVGFRDDSSPVYQGINLDKKTNDFKIPSQKSTYQKVKFVDSQEEQICNMHEVNDNQSEFGSLQNILIQANRNDSISAISVPDIRQLTNDTDSIFDSQSQNSNWFCDFEKFLNDAESLKLFSAFLKKEYSTENINFWVRVQKYRSLKTKNERRKEGGVIYENHLMDGAPELINIDHKMKNFTIEMINKANVDVFDDVQDQIFNLMKFDSYPRFLKSLKNRTDSSGDTNSGFVQPEQSLNQEEKRSLTSIHERRKSLLPWHRKSRYKSMYLTNSNKSSDSTNTSRPLSVINDNSNHSSMSSLDMAIVCNNRNDTDNTSTIDHLTRKNSSLCRISIDNGFTTVIHLNSNETIYELICRLLQKRSLNYLAFEVYKTKSSKPLNQNEDSLILSGVEVNVERRILFKLFLPNAKLISVKSKLTKILEDVLRPILKKYCYELDDMIVFYKNNDVIVDIKLNVVHVDGQELGVHYDPLKKSNSDMLLNSSVVVKRFHSKENGETIEKPANSFEKFMRRQSFIYDRNKKEYKINNLQENIKKPLITKLKAGTFLQQTVFRKPESINHLFTYLYRANIFKCG